MNAEDFEKRLKGELMCKFGNQSNNRVTREGMKHLINNFIQDHTEQGYFAIDHREQTVELYMNDPELIKVAMLGAIPNVRYKVLMLGLPVGYATYRGMTVNGDQVDCVTDFELEHKIEFVYIEGKLEP